MLDRPVITLPMPEKLYAMDLKGSMLVVAMKKCILKVYDIGNGKNGSFLASVKTKIILAQITSLTTKRSTNSAK